MKLLRPQHRCMIVVADTSPLLHLARISKLDLVPAVVGRVTIPRTVWGELVYPGTSLDVVSRVESAAWIEVVDDPNVQDLGLDAGETAAILLAEQLGAKTLLIDERRGRAVAVSSRHRGDRYTGHRRGCASPWPDRVGCAGRGRAARRRLLACRRAGHDVLAGTRGGVVTFHSRTSHAITSQTPAGHDDAALCQHRQLLRLSVSERGGSPATPLQAWIEPFTLGTRMESIPRSFPLLQGRHGFFGVMNLAVGASVAAIFSRNRRLKSGADCRLLNSGSGEC